MQFIRLPKAMDIAERVLPELVADWMNTKSVHSVSNGSYHTKTRTVAIGPVLPPKTRHFNITTLPPIKYLSSDRIVTSSVCRLCSSSRPFSSRFQICDPTNIR